MPGGPSATNSNAARGRVGPTRISTALSMFSALFAFAIAVAITALLTPVVRRLALAIGAVDAPTARRVHAIRIPRMGGIAIVIGFFVPVVGLFALDTQGARLLFAQPRIVGGLVLGSLLIVGLGLCDDILGVGAKRKLTIQVLAASIAFASGLRIEAISLPWVGPIALGWLSFPATLFWFCAIVNALNLIDGLDGLAAGVAFFACITNVVVAFLGHNVSTALLSSTLAGAILGFLFYNFNPARIFMGDSGSMFLGFVLAGISLLGSGTQKSPTLIAILVPVLALGLPLMDMLLAIVRRFLQRRSIFAADRGHIHHRLLELGLTHRRAVLALYGISSLFTVLALVVHVGRSWHVGVALLGLIALVVGTVRFAGVFSKRLTPIQTRDPIVEELRRGVPPLLSRIESLSSPSELQHLLERFAKDHGLLALEIRGTASGRVPHFRWETEISRAGLKEAVSARFSVADESTALHELEFYLDSADGSLAPQSEILLQLVADSIETLSNRVVRARAAATGHLRPVK